MDKLIKAVRTLASVPILGNVVFLVVSFLPLLLAFMLKVNLGLALIIGGIGMAALCYFLQAKNVIKILAPGSIPMWVLGVVLALAGVYSMVSDMLG